ncbi:hypothetical protein HF086_015377 [Spodoptera exigua]|uniref:Uncharacterized protein n=1 Tax=Spodoptera exigua TaxID=7107 RepID=A0A922S8N6_SPOEX|nr:hypothetical protein HF086_015377 [Spodoptera exigua]
MEAIQSSVQSPKVKCSEEVSEVKSEVLVKLEDDGDEVMSKGSQRENRLTSIIDQLRCQSKLKGAVVDHFYASSDGKTYGFFKVRCKLLLLFFLGNDQDI